MQSNPDDCERSRSHAKDYGFSLDHCRAMRHVGINPHTACDTCVHDMSERNHLAFHLRDKRSLGQVLDDDLRDIWGEVGELRRRVDDLARNTN